MQRIAIYGYFVHFHIVGSAYNVQIINLDLRFTMVISILL